MAYLMHHGIKGQRWGVRRFQNEDGSYTSAGKRRRAEKYSDEQYNRDKRVYGRFGANRINRRMLKGESISSARSAEASRIATARETGRYLGYAGEAIGSIAGLAGAQYVERALSKYVSDSDSYQFRFMVKAGTTAAGAYLGKYGGRSIAMLAGGYSPQKWRYN